ncbi:MAG TPA: PH domain-containing protein [Pyrinomonadaceae bacterium]|nr:PH domain-containing protein [Pyrinomonadaceae bacterium]HMP66122.1 PH domain-containing protein [Pyrinomonadaceae bacterium]
MKSTFRSKVDRWLAAIMIVAIISIPILAVISINEGWRLPAAVLFAFEGFIISVLWATYYHIAGGTPFVHSGPQLWRVPISDIYQITPTNDPPSSPALSLDRLRIVYGEGRSIMVSPVEKEAFIDAINAAKKG